MKQNRHRGVECSDLVRRGIHFSSTFFGENGCFFGKRVIAVSLRVLFHDTKKSVSLLSHLGIKSSARVLSRFAPGYKPDTKSGILVCYTPIWLDSTGERTPPLENA